jgi:transposase
VPALPSWLTEPLWDQFAALLPERGEVDPAHPLRCHRRRIGDRIVFDKLLQVLRFGCSYQGIADTTCSATTIRSRRDEWIAAGIFAALTQIALDAYDRIVGVDLEDIAVDGCTTKTPGGGEVAGSLTGRPTQARHETVPARPRTTALHRAGYWPGRTDTTRHCRHLPRTPSTISVRCPSTSPCISTPATTPPRPATKLATPGLHGEIAHTGDKAPIQAGQRRHVERTNA